MTELVLSVVGGASGGSAIGSSHIARGMPNQDAVGWEQRRLWTYIAVADGHGSTPHYRSDRGARLAVSTLIALFRELTRDGALREPEALARSVPNLAGALVARWREQVDADIARDPIREAAGFPSHTVYGSTCLGAAIGPGLALMLQIGDGDLFASFESGDVAQLFEADDTVGEQTYSLCLPDAAEHVKIALFTAPSPLCAPDFVFASTDGLAKSFEDSAKVLDIVRGYRGAIRERGLGRVVAELREWLTKCSQLGSGDDISVAIFTAEVETPEVALQARDSDLRPPVSASAGRPKFAGRAVVFGALACGVIGGLLAGIWAIPFIERIVSEASPKTTPRPRAPRSGSQLTPPGESRPAATDENPLPYIGAPVAPSRQDVPDTTK